MDYSKAHTKEELFDYILDVVTYLNDGWVIDPSIKTNRKNSVKIGIRKGSQTIIYRGLDYSDFPKDPNRHEIHLFGIKKDSVNRSKSRSVVEIWVPDNEGKYVIYTSSYPLSTYREQYGSSREV